jgi:hypothetical protein
MKGNWNAVTESNFHFFEKFMRIQTAEASSLKMHY